MRRAARGLTDAGFDAGLADSPKVGWCATNGPDSLIAAVDDAVFVEGKRSLRLQVRSAPAQGRPGLSQLLSSEAGKHRFTIRCRADAATDLLIQAGTWTEGTRFVGLAERRVDLGAGAWTTATLEVDVSAGTEEIGVFVYLPSQVGRSIWLDGAEWATVAR